MSISFLVDPPVPLWWGLPPNITLALALARALTLKVSESPLIGPGGQPLSLWSCYSTIITRLDMSVIPLQKQYISI